ncbi:MAG TPA: ISNCY family transposase [Clostridia bacterium]|nr:ISNCY family transposase [Clostridia bacterium]
MSLKQLNRLDIINKAIAGFMTVSEAASALGISERQVKRLKKDVKLNGPAALVHKNSLRKPACAIPDDTASKIVALKKSKIYEKANFNHFKELLLEHHDIKISYSALHDLLTSNGIKSPKSRRRFKPHRRRKRKKQAGLLLQVDASPFAWFGGRAKYALHGAIDDATGQITALYMCKNECLFGYFQMLRSIINDFGLPVSLYSDRHSIFRSPKADKISIEDQLAGVTANDTQFGRAVSELGITLIPARSPQAKGRIERLWETLQSRLPVEFAVRNIKTMEEANDFLPSYIFKFNDMFSVEPEDFESAFRPVPERLNLDYSLCIKEQRSLDRGGVFSYYNKCFKIVDSPYSNMIPPNSKITVLASPNFGIKVQYKNFVFDAVRFFKPKKAAAAPKEKPKTSTIPAASHPWRNCSKHKTPMEEYDKEILAMLSQIFKKGYA